MDEEQALQALVARGIRIPPQPVVLVELCERLRDGDYDARGLAAIISTDPGIAAMLFKVARSPLFHAGRSPDSLEQVLVRLGLKQTINLVRVVALTTALPAGGAEAMQRFWSRAREIARFAAVIAEDRVSVCNIFPDQAYMAGIFLDCGVPVLMQRFPGYCESLMGDDSLDLPSLREEDQRYNVDHASIGYLVARHWRLPDFVAQAILHYGEVPREELGAVRSLVAILQLAIHCYHGQHGIFNASWPRIGGEVMGELGLHPDELTDYLADIREAFEVAGI
ncbi:histidine kinase [Azoarcus sp. DD4]|uniref:HDOD domain-containing protein n=1 Tax=Azoarcus sp. DD4 TaxID=2027405 RepID=UPI0011298FFF|nr:HDOD domain-containing protein [Azoarcus sp. DD4]QDF96025.1 histidine kinase [Azoarcus sp. DD4]